MAVQLTKEVVTNNRNVKENTTMNIDVIASEVIEELNNRGFDNVSSSKVQKGMDTFTGITIRDDDSNIAPNIYLNNIEDLESLSIEKIADKIVATYKTYRQPSINIDDVFNWDAIKENLVLSIRPVTDDGAITEPFCDLELYVRAKIDVPSISDDDSTATITIKEDQLEHLGVTKEQVFNAARDDSYPTYNYMSMAKVMLGIMGDDMPDEVLKEMESVNPMYVLGNEDKLHGASVMACNAILKEVSAKLDDDLYILPSSIHEVIAVPACMSTPSELKCMVGEVNDGEVSASERLSYNVYRYTRSDNRVALA